MKSLRGTKTAENLLKSFAGESQARGRYTYYASVARKEGFIQISNIFIETAEQEREHAKRFYKFLKEDLQGDAIEITASYPIALYDNTADNLKAAASGENEEWTELYPSFAKVAREEGFPEVAVAYDMISKVEKEHEKDILNY
ncbi:rubrerythrin [Clostridium botulinum CFSAN001628]|nr:rubrerythrin [Clostridium botulinum CFSAN001628]